MAIVYWRCGGKSSYVYAYVENMSIDFFGNKISSLQLQACTREWSLILLSRIEGRVKLWMYSILEKYERKTEPHILSKCLQLYQIAIVNPTPSMMILRPPSHPISPLPTPPTPLLPRSPLTPSTPSDPGMRSHFLISHPIASPTAIVRPSSRASRPHHPDIHRKKEDRDGSEDNADDRGCWERIVAAVVVGVIWAAPAGENVGVHISLTCNFETEEVVLLLTPSRLRRAY